ncbi:2-hydroxyacid dehydrogenase [Bifidobacterium dolichotidis]|uniref:2-hydroxyacid dehydrogenase n=1 Tax=Bifidobacterium dolichotidis TaxID=2306976 RepID=A0A430FPK3_9BIFI|nr:NAD(P)-dependent oxidoreductase [Bifidobacterium dolichotidis]RSX54770.1 2-hydroxyacid dehydrogenase [Bifidobacterium dolichotidis]
MKIVMLQDINAQPAFIEQQRAKLAAQGHTLTIAYDESGVVSQNALADALREADAAIVANMDVPAAAVEQAQQLKFIDVAFTGVDRIPMDVCNKRGIVVSNAAGYATQSVVELVLENALSMLRHVDEEQQRVRSGQTANPQMGHTVSGKTVGIIGAGHIGRAVAHMFKALGCHVLAFNHSAVQCADIDEQVDLDELLRRSDIVTIHLPLTEQTMGLIDASKLALMKPTAVLINAARGPIVNTQDLAAALRTGTIAQAAVDVFDEEPPLSADNPLLHAPHTLLTPHIGYRTAEAMTIRAQIAFDNLQAWLAGQPQHVCH